MILSRRSFALGAVAMALSACGGPPAPVARASGLPDDLRPVGNPGYDAWVAAFRGRAQARGITQSTLAAAFQGVGYLPGVVTRDRNQTEFTRTFEDYLSIAISDARVAQGRAALARNRTILTAIEARYGVPAPIITAIWGLESFFGTRRGDVPVVSATSTLAYDGRRGRFFESELLAALRILQNGDIPARQMTGSWAGAMGHTQFMPSSYLSLAVDFTGDGRRDVWSDDPTDALASAANYLARNGWVRGAGWGRASADGALQPQAGGPRFSTGANFRVIRRYNPSDSYALAIGLLSDRIAGAPDPGFRFPPDANGLTKADRIALQNRLTARGFDTGGVDGVIGRQSQAAISAFQRSQGLPVTGQPSAALLARLGG